MTEIRYGVYSQAQTASQCQEDNAKQLDQTIETLKGLGVKETSIQTSAYGLSPIYDWNSGNRTITGYEMNTEITVSDIPLTRQERFLSQSVTAGVNQIESVTYFSSQYDEELSGSVKGRCRYGKIKGRSDGGGIWKEAFFCGRYSGIRLQSAGPIFLLQCPSSQDGSGRNGCSFRHGGNARRGQRRGPGYSDLWAGVTITKETRGLLSKKGSGHSKRMDGAFFSAPCGARCCIQIQFISLPPCLLEALRLRKQQPE